MEDGGWRMEDRGLRRASVDDFFSIFDLPSSILDTLLSAVL
jgi:hypothetical protein